MLKREERAAQYFLSGTNCAQAVLMAYADVLGLTEDQAAMIAVGHGGGMGRLRLHCGAFSAAVMLAGAIEGPHGADKEHRPHTYARVQAIHRRFVEENGTISCAELLGRAGVPENPTPEERTPEYYRKRPCERVIRSACRIIDEMMGENEA